MGTAQRNGDINLWDAESGKQLRNFTLPNWEGPSLRFVALAFSPDGSKIAAPTYKRNPSTSGNVIAVWGVQSGELIRTEPAEGAPYFIQWSADGKVVAAGSSKALEIRDATTWKVKHLLRHSAMLRGRFAMSDTGKFVAVGQSARDGRNSDEERAHAVVVWNTVTGEKVLDISGFVDDVALTPDGRYLLYGGQCGRPL